MAEATAFIDIRQSGNVIEVRADTLCTKALPGGEIDRLNDDGEGKPRAYKDTAWPNPIVTLADCQVGDVVFAKIIANDDRVWSICEVVSEKRLERHRGPNA